MLITFTVADSFAETASGHALKNKQEFWGKLSQFTEVRPAFISDEISFHKRSFIGLQVWGFFSSPYRICGVCRTFTTILMDDNTCFKGDFVNEFYKFTIVDACSRMSIKRSYEKPARCYNVYICYLCLFISKNANIYRRQLSVEVL